MLPGLLETPDRVAVLLPLPLDHPYDYKVPAGMDVQPGDIVLVPLGKREVAGVVWDPQEPGISGGDSPAEPEVVEDRLRPIIRLCAVPPMTPLLRRFVEWVADYTMAPQGAVLRMALSVPDALQAPKPVIAVRLAGGRGPNEAPGTGIGEGFKWTDARRRVAAEARDGMARSAN